MSAPLSQAQINKIRELRQEGLTQQAIAKAVNVCITCVYRHSRDITLSPRLSKARIKRIRKLRKEGLSTYAIAREMEITPSQAFYHSRDIQTGFYVTPAEIRKMKQLRKQGLSFQAIARKLKRSATTVKIHLKHVPSQPRVTYSEDLRDKAVVRRIQGMRYVDIAHELSIPYQTVWAWTHKYNVLSAPVEYTPSELKAKQRVLDARERAATAAKVIAELRGAG